MARRNDPPRGPIRVQLPGYAWHHALEDTFIADNEGWFEEHERVKGSVFVAYLSADQATLLGHALEMRAPLVRDSQSAWALRRAALRIEADVKVLGGPEPPVL